MHTFIDVLGVNDLLIHLMSLLQEIARRVTCEVRSAYEESGSIVDGCNTGRCVYVSNSVNLLRSDSACLKRPQRG